MRSTCTTETKLRRIEKRLDTLEETIEVLADRKLLRQVSRALEDVRTGRYKDYDDVEVFNASFEFSPAYRPLRHGCYIFLMRIV